MRTSLGRGKNRRKAGCERLLFSIQGDRFTGFGIDLLRGRRVLGTDAQVLARIADAVLLVVAYRETSRRGLQRAMELLGQVAAPVVGTVLNLVPAKDGYGGQPYRYESYRSRSERRRRREEVPRNDPVEDPPKHVAGNGASRQEPSEPLPPESAAQNDEGSLGTRSAPSRDLQQ